MSSTAIYAATAATWEPNNPRVVLRGIIEASPSASEEEVVEKLILRMKKSPALSRAVCTYFVRNALRQSKSKIVGSGSKVDIKERARILIANMQLPSGKLLLDSTGREVATFGDWGKAIAKGLKPDQKVSEVYKIDDLVKMWNERK